VIYDQKHVQNQVLVTLRTPLTFPAFSPSRALLAAMGRRGRPTRPKATARLQKLFIRFLAAWQIAVTQ
jgi:hypothetical protein